MHPLSCLRCTFRTLLLTGLLAILLLVPHLDASSQEPDTSPPQVVDLSISPSSIKTDEGDAVLTVTLHATDDISGASDAFVAFVDPEYRTQGIQTVLQLSSGTRLDGVFTGQISIPQYSMPQTYTLNELDVYDVAGNPLYLSPDNPGGLAFPYQFTITGTGDTEPPTVANFTVSPTEINASGGEVQVTVTAHITDNLSGVEKVSFGCQYPQVNESGAPPIYYEGTPPTRTGDARDAMYTSEITFPQFAPSGTCDLIVSAIDRARLYGDLFGPYLAERGFPSQIVISSTGDSTPPHFLSATLSPAILTTTMDQSGEGSRTRMLFSAADDVSGIKQSWWCAHNVDYPIAQVCGSFDVSYLISGTLLDGTFESYGGVHVGSPYGTYRVDELSITDQAGNEARLTLSELTDLGIALQFQYVNTLPGENVVVAAAAPEDGSPTGATLTFATNSSFGVTTATTPPDSPSPLPQSYSTGSETQFYEIKTTADYSGQITVCLDYAPSDYPYPENVRLLHFEDGAWHDVTSTNDTTAGVVCGQVTSLSPFVAAQSRFTFIGFAPPVDNANKTNLAKAGRTIPIKWSLRDASGRFISDVAAIVRYGFGSVACTSGITDVIEEYAETGDTGLHYEPGSDQFILNAKTDARWAGSCKIFTLLLADGAKYQALFHFQK